MGTVAFCTTVMSGKPHIEITLVGMSGMLKSIADFLIQEKILRVNPKIYKDKRSKACSIYMYGEDALKDILDYLYKDSTIYLDRKYRKYAEFYKDYDNDAPRYGVYYDKVRKVYVASISIDGVRHKIGRYKDVHEANAARIQAEINKLNKTYNAS